ncbi:MAG: hypothetical protein RIC80_19015 [Cyclobacteriaceae bacterium]
MKAEELVSIVEQSINDRQLSDLNPYFSKDAKIYEQGSIDESWEAYRDGHLGHEIEAFESFNIDFQVNESFTEETMAFVRGFYDLQAIMNGDSISSRGLVTFAMIGEETNWKIVHLQFSRGCK